MPGRAAGGQTRFEDGESRLSPVRILRLTLAYDGTNYAGWQRQTNGPSVQQAVEDAFLPLLGGAGIGRGVAGASRTDAGVHALGQVASFECDLRLDTSAIHRALNIRLPADVRVLGVEDAPAGFHARFSAAGKSYRYRISTSPILSPFDRWFVWHNPAPLSLAAMQEAAAALTGRHDFASFQARNSSITDTVRTVDRLDVARRGEEIVIDIAGDGFLRHMVRGIVGTLADIGVGTRQAGSVGALLDARDRRAAGPTAPACGLTLVSVQYAEPARGAE